MLSNHLQEELSLVFTLSEGQIERLHQRHPALNEIVDNLKGLNSARCSDEVPVRYPLLGVFE